MAPPSGLPAISPSRGEISALPFHHYENKAGAFAPASMSAKPYFAGAASAQLLTSSS
jgi:hypothetical protein